MLKFTSSSSSCIENSALDAGGLGIGFGSRHFAIDVLFEAGPTLLLYFLFSSSSACFFLGPVYPVGVSH
ncbi:hypothetical protein BDW69DRAFT_140842 [Aspergillus filifer]